MISLLADWVCGCLVPIHKSHFLSALLKALTVTACQLLTENLHNLDSLVQHSAFSTTNSNVSWYIWEAPAIHSPQSACRHPQ